MLPMYAASAAPSADPTMLNVPRIADALALRSEKYRTAVVVDGACVMAMPHCNRNAGSKNASLLLAQNRMEVTKKALVSEVNIPIFSVHLMPYLLTSFAAARPPKA